MNASFPDVGSPKVRTVWTQVWCSANVGPGLHPAGIGTVRGRLQGPGTAQSKPGPITVGCKQRLPTKTGSQPEVMLSRAVLSELR